MIAALIDPAELRLYAAAQSRAGWAARGKKP